LNQKVARLVVDRHFVTPRKMIHHQARIAVAQTLKVQCARLLMPVASAEDHVEQVAAESRQHERSARMHQRMSDFGFERNIHTVQTFSKFKPVK
jgi:hypothetical protein